MSKTIPTITLNNHTEMPLCGLGVYKATGANEVETACLLYTSRCV